MGKAISGRMLLFILALTVVLGLVHSQSQIGFISIDCGASADYIDSKTGLFYSTDAPYIRSGQNYEVLLANNETQFNNVRSFPNGTRNCYSILPQVGKDIIQYLVRARFMYGNYDSKNVLPEFDLYLGVNLWRRVNFTSATNVVSEELVHVIRSNVTYICLVNIGLGTPFISAIEVRPLLSQGYETDQDTIALHQRLDFGNQEKNIRFPDDAYDRIWERNIWGSTMTSLTTNSTFDVGVTDIWLVTPTVVMGTVMTPIISTDPIEFYLRAPDRSSKFLILMHFGEVEKLQQNQTREFVLKLNGFAKNDSIVPRFLITDIYQSTKPISLDWFNYTLERTVNSTLPPIINALEVFIVKDFSRSETDQADIIAIREIQAAYGVVKDWVADPCAPQNHTWNGIDCTYSNFDPPRIISMNLSSSGLTGTISDYISDLKMLQRLDLSNNNLTGSVPDFLSQMTLLTVLNLSGNNLTGTLPSGLAEKSQQGSLLLSVEGNPNLCSSGSCMPVTTSPRNKSNVLVPIIASAVGVVALMVMILIVVSWRTRRKNRKGGREDARDTRLHLKERNTRFSYSDVRIMTNNFKTLLGRGGGGEVFYGVLEDKSEVAVKVLKPFDSNEAVRQFQTEAEILMMVHHANLASMIGYCHEGKNLCVVYELMANGNLEDYLSPSKNPKFPSWEERLNMALHAAQGLEYLHGCKPAIIHRDVKTTNILLNKALQAKLADFGISKIFPNDKCTHVTTGLMGTPGYMDPEYMMCPQLNDKTDVYGFGVVLCEILTGQRAIIDIGGGVMENITSWVSKIIAVKGDVRAAVDPRLQGDFDVNSAWKLVETATACVATPSSLRPTMSQVVVDLTDCLEMEKARKLQLAAGRRRGGH